MTDQWCIRDITTAQIHHVDNARIFGGNDTREVELRPPWGSFGVSGHLHIHRSQDRCTKIGRATNNKAAWWCTCTSRSAGVVTSRGRDPYQPTCPFGHASWDGTCPLLGTMPALRDVHVHHAADAEWAARVLLVCVPSLSRPGTSLLGCEEKAT